jgi:hypothetical protein
LFTTVVVVVVVVAAIMEAAAALARLVVLDGVDGSSDEEAEWPSTSQLTLL